MIQDVIVPIVVSVISSLVTFWVVNVFYTRKQAKRRDKMYVFSMLMSTRDMLEKEWVKALNVITVVFADNEKVIGAWRNYHTSLKVDKKEDWTDTKRAEARKLQIKLLEAMATDLDYKNITWDVIDDSYYPEWLKNHDLGLQNQNKFISQGADLIERFPDIVDQISGKKGSGKR